MTRKVGMSVPIDRTSFLLDTLSTLVRTDVLVGIPADKAERHEKGETFNNATLGYIHEFGSPKANIPPRPFLYPGVHNARNKVMPRIREATRAVLKGDNEAASRQLHAAGLIAVNEVRAVINAGPPPELSERTLAARRARGRTGTVPLIDTGQLRNSITYVLRVKK